MKLFWTATKIVFYTILLLMTAWIFISWWDIITDNLARNPQHYDWNFFVLTLK